MIPMLARPVRTLTELDYPLYVSPKLDGIRALMINGRAWSRDEKLIQNKSVQAFLAQHGLHGMDGELLLRDMTGPMRNVTSAIMSHDGEPDFVYSVFDAFHLDRPYVARLKWLQEMVGTLNEQRVGRFVVTPVHLAASPDEVMVKHERFVKMGYEGSILRKISAPYKCGRSTLREAYLLKLKDVEDEEAYVVELKEELHNGNEKQWDGSRPGGRVGKTGKGRLGSVWCKFISDGVVFKCGGFTNEDRERFWADPSLIMGKKITVIHQPPRERGQAPRFPRFKTIRED